MYNLTKVARFACHWCNDVYMVITYNQISLDKKSQVIVAYFSVRSETNPLDDGRD